MSHTVVSKENFKQIIDSSVNKAQFQKFIEIVTHAQTCPQCATHYNAALSLAEKHTQEFLR